MPPTPPERLHPGNRRFNATANWIMRALLIAFTRYRVEGRQHIPREGAFILAANHLSYTDPPTLAASARRHVIFMTKQEILRMPVLGLVARLYGSFGIRRGEADLSALRKAQGALNSSAVLGMFPEGTRARRRGLGRPHPGVALLALRTNALIVPAAIWGTQQILPRLPLVPFLRPRVTVRFGEPFRLPPVSRITAEEAERGARLIMERITRLLPPEALGEYGRSLLAGEKPPGQPRPSRNAVKRP